MIIIFLLSLYEKESERERNACVRERERDVREMSARDMRESYYLYFIFFKILVLLVTIQVRQPLCN